jgi:xylulose-5-phosphate/fructose-6-phosphate phosphoketolase
MRQRQLESLAATSLLEKHIPDLRIRLVNVVDIMTLQPASEHPHDLADEDFDDLMIARHTRRVLESDED